MDDSFLDELLGFQPEPPTQSNQPQPVYNQPQPVYNQGRNTAEKATQADESAIRATNDGTTQNEKGIDVMLGEISKISEIVTKLASDASGEKDKCNSVILRCAIQGCPESANYLVNCKGRCGAYFVCAQHICNRIATKTCPGCRTTSLKRSTALRTPDEIPNL